MACQRTSLGRPSACWRGRALLVVVSLATLSSLNSCAVTVSLPVAAASPTSTSPMTVSLTIVKGGNNSTLAIAPVYIGKQGPFHFIVDTGASVSLIRRELALQLELPPSGSRQPVTGVGGVEQVVFVDVRNWRADRLALPHTAIGSGTLLLNTGDSNVDGLLGSDIWSRFGKVTIDYNAATLTVYRSLAA